MSHEKRDFNEELNALRENLPEVVEETTPSKSHPVAYSLDLAKRVVDFHAQGISLYKISGKPGMPGYNTLLRWSKEHPELSTLLRSVREARALHFEDAAIDTAEEATGKDADRLRFEAYKWGAEVNDPATYGKRSNVQAEVRGQVVLQVVTGFGPPNAWQTPPKLKADGTIDRSGDPGSPGTDASESSALVVGAAAPKTEKEGEVVSVDGKVGRQEVGRADPAGGESAPIRSSGEAQPGAGSPEPAPHADAPGGDRGDRVDGVPAL